MLNIECNFSIASHIVTYSMAISFGGLFFFEEPLQRGQGAPTIHLRRKELTRFTGKLGPKTLQPHDLLTVY